MKTLKDFRKEAGYTTAGQFAEEMGLGYQSYLNYERDPMKLGISLDEVYGRDFKPAAPAAEAPAHVEPAPAPAPEAPAGGAAYLDLDSDALEGARALYESLGMDLATAVNVFLRQSIAEAAMPFKPGSRAEGAAAVPAACSVCGGGARRPGSTIGGCRAPGRPLRMKVRN